MLFRSTPVYGVTRGNQPHIHPQAVQLAKHPTLDKAGEEKSVWTTAGDYVAVVTGFGNSVSQSTKRAYKTVENLHIANLIVRDDVGEGLKEQLPKLHKMEYALHCNY